MNLFFARLLSLLLFLAFFQKPQLPGGDRHAEPLLDNCDLIFRDGKGKESDLIKMFALKDRTFSHVGIGFVEHGKAMVYNMIGGEENASGKMVRQSFQSFIDSATNDAYSVYSLQINTDEKLRLKHYTDSLYHSKVRFDYLFKLDNGDSLYCTEFVVNAIRYATNGRISLGPVNAEVPTLLKIIGRKEFKYYPIDYVQTQPFLKEKATKIYRKPKNS